MEILRRGSDAITAIKTAVSILEVSTKLCDNIKLRACVSQSWGAMMPWSINEYELIK